MTEYNIDENVEVDLIKVEKIESEISAFGAF